MTREDFRSNKRLLQAACGRVLAAKLGRRPLSSLMGGAGLSFRGLRLMRLQKRRALDGVTMIRWDEVADEFAWEGSWRDICVRHATIADWRSVWGLLNGADFDTNYSVGGACAALPRSVDELFGSCRADGALMTIRLCEVSLNCHFFDQLEVEFDLDPREVTSQRQLDAVVAFMKALARATNKVAMMTPENMHEMTFLQVTPTGTAEYHSTNGFFRDLAAPTR